MQPRTTHSSLFELPKGEKSKIKTEILFIDVACRCCGQVAGSASSFRKELSTIPRSPMCVSSARTVHSSAPWSVCLQETFLSSGASVKASLLFMQKFTAKEQADFDAKHAKARVEVEKTHAPAIAKETKRIEEAVAAAETGATPSGGRPCKNNWPNTKGSWSIGSPPRPAPF